MTSRSKSVHRRFQQAPASDREFFSSDNSPIRSDSQLPIKNIDLLYRRPSFRYTKSSKNKFVEQKIDEIEKAYNIPESFTSQNLRIKEKLRERSYIKSVSSDEKFKNSPLKPIKPVKESYQKVLR